MKKVILFFLIGVILFWIAMTDYRKKKIPNQLLFLLLVCAAGAFAVMPEIHIIERILGSVTVCGILLLMIWLYPRSFGAGDVKLMAVSGLIFGFGKNMAAFVFAVGLAGIYCAAGLLTGKRKRNSEIAFGPFLCSGMILTMIWGDEFIRWFIEK